MSVSERYDVSVVELLQVLRLGLHELVMSLLRGGPESKEAVIAWFSSVLRLNTERTKLQMNRRLVSNDGFMLNVVDVLLRLCMPFADPKSPKLANIDPTFVFSTHRIDYGDETRISADSAQLSRWIDPRNKNIQESLQRRQMLDRMEAEGENVAVEDIQSIEVSNSFGFVTECFFMAVRAIHLGFSPTLNLYTDVISRELQRARSARDALEAAAIGGNPEHQQQLAEATKRLDLLLMHRLCYEVYLLDSELITGLLHLASADAAWLLSLLGDASRQEILPLPLPPPAKFASLPEYCVEFVADALNVAERFSPRVIENNAHLLEDIMIFVVSMISSPIHVKNPYLRSKLVEFMYGIVPRVDDGGGSSR